MRKSLPAIVLTVLSFLLALLVRSPGGAKNELLSVALMPADGLVILSGDPVSVKRGESASFSVEIEKGYALPFGSDCRYEEGKLYVDDVTVSRSVYFAPRRACALRVEEASAPYVELSAASGLYAGDSVRLRVDPPAHYSGARVLMNGEAAATVAAGEECAFPIYEDSLLTLELMGEKLEFAVMADSIGSVTIEGAREEYRYGDEMRLKAEYDAQYVRFDGWSTGGYLGSGGALASADPVKTLTLTDDLTLYANFTDLKTYTVYIDPNGGTAARALRLENCSAGRARYLPCDDGTLRREGYTLIGYNTQPDGSGAHYAPASPLMVTRGDCTLYAEWMPETPASALTYKTVSGGVRVTGRCGDIGDTLCVPARINGEPVRAIEKNAFSGDEALKTVVLPLGLREIGEGAFSGCAELSMVYLPDSLTSVGDKAFSSTPNLRHMRVLSQTDTRVYENTFEAGLADRYMRLLSAEGKRLILVSGSSGSFGLRSELLAERFPGYTVINFSGSYRFGIRPLLAYVQNHVHEGDIVILAPEYYDTMYAARASSGFANWQYLECNYNMLDDLDLGMVWSAVFTSYPEFLAEKKALLPGKQAVRGVFQRSKLNEYGDNTAPRTHKTKVAQYIPDTSVLITEKGRASFAAFDSAVSARGAACLFSFPPVSVGKTLTPALTSAYQDVTRRVSEMLSGTGITLISEAAAYLFPADAFYDNKYHMTSDGTQLRTRQLIKDLEASGLMD